MGCRGEERLTLLVWAVHPGVPGKRQPGGSGRNHTWFLAFAPADAPRVAVAVALSDQSGTGGVTAAPIAKEIIEAVLGRNT